MRKTAFFLTGNIPDPLTISEKLAAHFTAFVSEYELFLAIGCSTFLISIALNFDVSLHVGLLVAKKNKKIDMVEAVKGAE